MAGVVKNMSKIILGILITAIVVATLATLFAFNDNDIFIDDCTSYGTKTGFLNGKENAFDLIIDNETWYVSDYYHPDGWMPVGFSDYFGHNVKIEYVWGCGRVMIYNVEVI